MSTQETIEQFAERLSNAYSTDRYRNEWRPSIRALRRAGYDDRQIEAIIRSKWTRWAADHSDNRYGRVTAKDLMAFVRREGMDNVRALTRESFGD